MAELEFKSRCFVPLNYEFTWHIVFSRIYLAYSILNGVV